MFRLFLACMSVCAIMMLTSCDYSQPSISQSGIKKASVKVPTNPNGLTTEQMNIRDRLIIDNKPGSIKHLYVISAYSGQVLIYSTVRGKVTSSGKRLQPTSIVVNQGNTSSDAGPGFTFVQRAGQDIVTDEVVQDDGTFGHSIDYLYWWDAKGVYHQHYVSGGQILHISSEPVAVKNVVINLEK